MKYLLSKKRTCCLLLLCLTLFLVGCNDKKTATNKPVPSTDSGSTNQDSVSTKVKKGLDITDFDKLLVQEIHKDENIQIDKFNWNICAFQLDEKTFSLPFSYERIKENWTFSLEDYGLDKDFKLEPLTKTSDNVVLKCEGKPYTLKVGFFNPFSTSVTLDQAKIWSLEIDITTPELNEKTLENDSSSAVNSENADNTAKTTTSLTGDVKPTMILPKGIQMHSSIASVLLAYGNPENSNLHNTETGYYEFNYQHNYSIFLSLTIDEQEGLVKISYKHFPNGAINEMPEENK